MSRILFQLRRVLTIVPSELFPASWKNLNPNTRALIPQPLKTVVNSYLLLKLPKWEFLSPIRNLSSQADVLAIITINTNAIGISFVRNVNTNLSHYKNTLTTVWTGLLILLGISWLFTAAICKMICSRRLSLIVEVLRDRSGNPSPFPTVTITQLTQVWFTGMGVVIKSGFFLDEARQSVWKAICNNSCQR